MSTGPTDLRQIAEFGGIPSRWVIVLRDAANEIERLEGDLQVPESFSQWKCVFCEEVGRGKAAAMLHAPLCEKWPYRLRVESLEKEIDSLSVSHESIVKDLHQDLMRCQRQISVMRFKQSDAVDDSFS